MHAVSRRNRRNRRNCRTIAATCMMAVVVACGADSVEAPRSESLSTTGKSDTTTTTPPPDTTTHSRPDTSTTYTPPPPAAQFNLNLNVVGRPAGTDTINVVPIANAKVVVTRFTDVRGDTLHPAVVAGTVTTDATGKASLANLPGGAYMLTATPPTGSTYQASTIGLGMPMGPAVYTTIFLPKAP
jgi:hypothetical protein